MAVIVTGRYTNTQNLAVLAARTARLLRVNKQSMVIGLVATPSSAGIADAKGEFASMANEVNGQILADVPSLRRVTTTVTVTAGTNSVGIPSTVHRNQILDVQYYNTSDALNLMPLRWIGKMDARRLPTMIQNGQYLGTYAQLVALDPTEANLLFYPWLSGQTTFNILSQQAPDVFTAADFDDDASTNYAVVPDAYDEVIPTFLAMKMARIMRDATRFKELEEDMFGKPTNGFMGIYEKFKIAMGYVPSNTNQRRYSYSNQHPDALATPFNGTSFDNGPGGQFGSR